MSNKIRVTGGMNKKWLSNIAKSKDVDDAVKSVSLSAKRIAEAKSRNIISDDKLHGFLRRENPNGKKEHPAVNWFYGMTSLNGTWGKSYIIFPTNMISRKSDTQLNNSVTTAGARKK